MGTAVRTASLTAAAAFATIVAITAGASPKPADWPGWRGPNRDGISPDKGLLTQWAPGAPPLHSRIDGLGAGLSSISVAGGRIYTMGDSGGTQNVVAIDQASGKVLWSAKVGAPWTDEYGGPRGTPTVSDGIVYAMGTEGDLVALEAATGKERWRKNMERDFGGRMMSMWKWAESPLVDADRLVVTPGVAGAGLVALDKKTGREIWRSKLADFGPKGKDGAAYSGIVISNAAGVKQYIQLIGRGVIGVAAADGRALWGYNRVANDVANIPTPVVRGDYVFASTGYGTGSVLLKLTKSGDGVAANEVYFLDPKVFQNHHGGFVLVGDYLYAGHGHNKGFPICVELSTGKVMWGGDIRNSGTGSAAVGYADGNLYFRYQNGQVLLIEATPTGYHEKGMFTIPDVKNPSWPHPVIADGKLYLREQDHLYVYDVRQR